MLKDRGIWGKQGTLNKVHFLKGWVKSQMKVFRVLMRLALNSWLLTLIAKCWGYRNEPPHPAHSNLRVLGLGMVSREIAQKWRTHTAHTEDLSMIGSLGSSEPPSPSGLYGYLHLHANTPPHTHMHVIKRNCFQGKEYGSLGNGNTSHDSLYNWVATDFFSGSPR